MKPNYPTKILVTTDFSVASYCAFPYALGLAQQGGSSVTLVNVLDLPALTFSYDYVPSPEEVESFRENARLEAEKKLKKLLTDHLAGVSADRVVLEGMSWSADTVVQYAAKENFDLIIIASQGHGLLGRLFLGSVTERILRQAPCPVLVVPFHKGVHEQVLRYPWRNIVVTTDFSERAQAVFALAQGEKQRTDAQLTLVHVAERPLPHAFFEASRSLREGGATPQDSYAQELEKKLVQSAAQFEGAGVTHQLIPKVDTVAKSIKEFLVEKDADLLVISTRGEGARVDFLGGVIERIVRESSCPVFVVPAKVI